jgi:hypothetical protein
MDNERSEIILYEAPNGQTKIDVLFEGETVWLNQQQISAIFERDRTVITRHIGKIFAEGELDEKSNVQKMHFANSDKPVTFYSLDVIISVGYRVSSMKATQFRIWATNTLREFIVKGFVLDDERLKLGKRFGQDYFEELLERIREIRASERRFYQKITDLFAACSVDYDSRSPVTKTFYQTVQNKLHWAIIHKTAAEIVAERADAAKPKMGLRTWKNATKGKIQKSDITIAKNYLSEEELRSLDRVVGMYLDYAENQASRQIAMTMQDWATKLDAFLQFNEYEILQDAGRVSHEVAAKLAEKEYAKFRVIQDREFESDFDREIKKLKEKPKL